MELLVAVVIASFIGSLHCVGMCGPLVAFAVGDPARRKAGVAGQAPCGLSRRPVADLRAGRRRLRSPRRGGRSRRGPAGLSSGRGAAGRRNDDRRGRWPPCCGPSACACPRCRLPGLIQRLVLAGQRAAFALTAAAAGVVHRSAHGLSALRLALLVRLLCRRDRQSAVGRAVHDRLLAGQRAGIGAGRRRRADACPAAGAASAAGHRRWRSWCLAWSRLCCGCKRPCWPSNRPRSKPDAASVKQVEELGKTVPPCCRKAAEGCAVKGLHRFHVHRTSKC